MTQQLPVLVAGGGIGGLAAALALVRQDKPQQARLHVQKARNLALANGQTALAAKAEEFLKHYR